MENVMEIISRKDAILTKSSKYFTGKPCKNGHLSERYTQSGVCKSCLHQSHRPRYVEMPEEKEARMAFVARRTEILNGLVEVKVLARAGRDLETLYDTAEALCRARFPDILDVDARGIRTKVREHPIYSLTVPLEDAQMMRDTAGVLWRQVPPDMHALHQRLRAAAANAETPVAEWADKP